MRTCVGEGILEAMIDLAQRPRNDVKTIVMHALDTLVELIKLAEPLMRRAILSHAARCDALRICVNVSGTFDASRSPI